MLKCRKANTLYLNMKDGLRKLKILVTKEGASWKVKGSLEFEELLILL